MNQQIIKEIHTLNRELLAKESDFFWFASTQLLPEKILLNDKTGNFKTKPIVEPEMVIVQGRTFSMGTTPEQGEDCEDQSTRTYFRLSPRIS